METLTAFYKKLLRETDTGFNRYLYSDINWRNRIIGIKGPRGVGKTTLMLQHIKQDMNPDDVLYVNADDIYFSSHRLLDLAGLLVQRGIHYFYIDEIHKYKEWSRELKLIYDYYSELNVVFSGSSVLDLTKGTSDLSRRAVLYHLYDHIGKRHSRLRRPAGLHGTQVQETACHHSQECPLQAQHE